MPRSLKEQLGAIASAESVSISDLVRRALSMHLAGGPERWLELERSHAERRGASRQTAKDDLSPETRRLGEWMRSLSPDTRVLLHSVGEAAMFEGPTLLDGNDVFEASPVPIWCVELREPVRDTMPLTEQRDRIRRSARPIAANPACHGEGTERTSRTDTHAPDLPEVLFDDEILSAFLSGAYRLTGWPLSQEGIHTDRPVGAAETVMLLHLWGQRDGEDLVRIWGIEVRHDDPGATSWNAAAHQVQRSASTDLPPAPPHGDDPSQGTRYEGS